MKQAALVAALLFWSISGAAEGAAAIHIASDSLEIDAIAETSVYQGHVVLEQGGIRVEAQSLVLHSKNREVRRLDASGHPVRFSKKASGEARLVEAWADRLSFDFTREELLLRGSAGLRDGGNRFEGDRLSLNLKSRLVRANQGKEQKKTGRVTMVLTPASSPVPGDAASDKVNQRLDTNK